MINQELLQDYARQLEELVKVHADTDEEVARFYGAMKIYLDQANAGALTTPFERGSLPGERYFIEGTLRKYHDLEAAYYGFAVEATGGETPALRALKNRMGES